MIAWLRGILREKHPPTLLLDLHGVGYEIEAPITTFSALPGPGEETVLHTHQIIREDAHRLYGFAERSDRDIFRLLLRVNGVGARMALAILSGMDAAAFSRCVHENDATRLERLPGIGKKTAGRLIMEMRDRLDAVSAAGAASPVGGGEYGPSGEPSPSPRAEAISALVALGLKPPDASRRIEAIDCTGLACEEIVRRALKAMGNQR
uniref:Holliday junction branch migration complex subunit RuvA n=1 Tax=Candidatus Kentrum eta TaxID=2126337 RepID=A0A450U6M9_9GAMM|nr:MAG: Holliday junction DNA helicase subunit RuvA [Candidatus Kentron sp. H]VFJ88900.1 MAG: Holliday junction DNA helicase subunit RuvA [Candidatus Kentron sp. H]VFJ95136.1 MAG: Holliday junction DNA helicase subunit RuvA [Candidatus Kentron sp. H]